MYNDVTFLCFHRFMETRLELIRMHIFKMLFYNLLHRHKRNRGRTQLNVLLSMFLVIAVFINRQCHLYISGDSNSKPNFVLIGSLIGVACLAFVLTSALVFVMKRRSSVNQTAAASDVLAMDNFVAKLE